MSRGLASAFEIAANTIRENEGDLQRAFDAIDERVRLIGPQEGHNQYVTDFMQGLVSARSAILYTIKFKPKE